jgi:ankyrin repeat protein
MYSVESGNSIIFNLLLNNKLIDINKKNNYDYTAFMYACMYNLDAVKSMVQYILDKSTIDETKDNIDIYVCDKKGNNGFMHACKKNKADVVEYLLPYYKDLNMRNIKGETAFMLACKSKYKKNSLIKNSLIKNNLNNISIKSEVNDSSKIKKEFDNKNDMIMLDEHSCQYNSKLLDYIENTEVVELLLKNEQIDHNIQCNKGYTGFMLACKKNNKKIVELLLTKNIDIELKNKKNWNGSMYACYKGNIDIINMLHEKEREKILHLL